MNNFDISGVKIMSIAFCAAIGWELGKTVAIAVDTAVVKVAQKVASSNVTRGHKDPVFED